MLALVSYAVASSSEPEYREWTVGPLSSATRRPIIMQFTGCHHPVQRSYWPQNASDWLA